MIPRISSLSHFPGAFPSPKVKLFQLLLTHRRSHWRGQSLKEQLRPGLAGRVGASFGKRRSLSRRLLRRPLPQPPECLSPIPTGRGKEEGPAWAPPSPPNRHQPPAARLPDRQGPATEELGAAGPGVGSGVQLLCHRRGASAGSASLEREVSGYEFLAGAL